jgi:hypothetical protein
LYENEDLFVDQKDNVEEKRIDINVKKPLKKPVEEEMESRRRIEDKFSRKASDDKSSSNTKAKLLRKSSKKSVDFELQDKSTTYFNKGDDSLWDNDYK